MSRAQFWNWGQIWHPFWSRPKILGPLCIFGLGQNMGLIFGPRTKMERIRVGPCPNLGNDCGICVGWQAAGQADGGAGGRQAGSGP